MHTQGESAHLPTRDGRTLHAAVLPGPEDAPIVVFEAGAAASRSTWAAVQPAVAGFATAVAYDRSGLGRSAPDPVARTLDRMADDLNDLLDGLGADRRFILVGHSAGGPIVRLAASRRPERIAALVLVDPTDEAADVLFGAPFRILEQVMVRVGWVLARLGLLERVYAAQFADAPADVREDAHREAFTPGVMTTHRRQARTFLAELAAWRGGAPDLGDIPVTVISGANAGDGMNASMRAAANDSHATRAQASPRGRHVLAENSGHLVPMTDPELIVEEIRRLVSGPAAEMG
ncbi:alpha/beta fold hydrolase [Tsukamurella ocularis]|uniref:alpha/beta fold hydrolase n=1 Tax=Tsukamurella ocularis TaxID=1970234 RepID=UPI0021674E09|nr:alpha/beta hydrolase [Tsukamurella ocularis]MCS3779825.1 pimeloyl-ACP methyl ester carboxylesterase [Tsukamurella ocularis]MCS3788775.1 pimeloyl-ACP methyl ester carboxylesterase [Tsukamurella ocularis]MCS3849985.1 pimeloyl-ACP methyl ester carboxylesterase [Tsukamurella ocularis]